MSQGFEIEQLVKERYLITKRLDKSEADNENKSIGAFGYVYLALDTLEDNRPVVIKALKDEWLDNAAVKKLFLKEAEALNRLTEEPRVVQLLSSKERIAGEVFFLEESKRPFFVLEFIKGDNLRKKLKDGRLGFQTVSHYVEQLAIALNAVHEGNIIHRDLKPENIMIVEKEGQPDQLKIIDFGTALVGYSLYFPSTIYTDAKQKPFVGTPAYASPEHLAGNETAVGEVFTLAAIAYEMLTGEIAFLSGSIEQVKELQKTGVEFPKFLPAETIEVLKKGMAVRPSDRFQTPSEFARELKKSLVDDNNFVPPKPAENRKALWKKLIPVVSVMLLAAAGLFGFNYWKSLNPAGKRNADASDSPKTPAPVAETFFSYSFDVQKMKNNLLDGSAFETPDKSKISFGDKFNLKVERRQEGHFYIVEQNADSFDLIFPNENQTARNISAWRVAKPNQSFWFVWSRDSVGTLEKTPAAPAEIKRFFDEHQKNVEAVENLNKMEVKGSVSLAIYKFSTS